MKTSIRQNRSIATPSPLRSDMVTFPLVFRALSCLFVAIHFSPSSLQAQPDLTLFDPGPLPPTDSEPSVAAGDPAPDFELPNIEGKPVRLSDYRGQSHVLLTFVPAAWTPVCSAQWPGYNLVLDDFAQHGVEVLGITVDNRPTLHAWTQAMGGLDFPVLSDFHPHGAVSKKYGILRSDGTSERALILIDKSGIIRYLDVHDINQRPPLEDLFEAIERLAAKR